MTKLKMSISEAPILLLPKNNEVEANFTIFFKLGW
jgi:hypothetical protein